MLVELRTGAVHLTTGGKAFAPYNQTNESIICSASPREFFVSSSEIAMPSPTTIASLVDELREIVGIDGVLFAGSELLVFECDGYQIEKNSPDVAVFPRTTDEVARVVQAAVGHDMPIVPRGAGTSLAGGCLPVGGGVMVVLTRMKRILEINLRDRYAIVEPGVVNAWLNQALSGMGYHYAPDPSSQGACTIGGNVATNSGGPHTLKYGVTVNHVLGLEAVLADGRVIRCGGPAEDSPGLDLVGALVGSEGTLAVVTKIWVRLTRNPQGCRTMLAVYDSIDAATNTISQIIGAGIIPAALEMMDQGIVSAIEQAYHFGFPLDAQAVLLIEVDGLEAGLDGHRDVVADLCRQCGSSATCNSRPTPRNGNCFGRAASRRSAQSAGLARTIARKTGSFPARSCHIFCGGSSKSARNTTSESSTYSMPATAISIRSFCSTNASPARSIACSKPAVRFWRNALPAAAA